MHISLPLCFLSSSQLENKLTLPPCSGQVFKKNLQIFKRCSDVGSLPVPPAAVALWRRKKQGTKCFKSPRLLIRHPRSLQHRNIGSPVCGLELRGCVQQYSSFRVNQHYPDQLTGLTWLLWERGVRQSHVEPNWSHRVTGSNCIYSDEVGSFSCVTMADSLCVYMFIATNVLLCFTATIVNHSMRE